MNRTLFIHRIHSQHHNKELKTLRYVIWQNEQHKPGLVSFCFIEKNLHDVCWISTSDNSNTTSVTSGSETAYPSGVPEFIPSSCFVGFMLLHLHFSVLCFVDHFVFFLLTRTTQTWVSFFLLYWEKPSWCLLHINEGTSLQEEEHIFYPMYQLAFNNAKLAYKVINLLGGWVAVFALTL
jgi:hypothetical protein